MGAAGTGQGLRPVFLHCNLAVPRIPLPAVYGTEPDQMGNWHDRQPPTDVQIVRVSLFLCLISGFHPDAVRSFMVRCKYIPASSTAASPQLTAMKLQTDSEFSAIWCTGIWNAYLYLFQKHVRTCVQPQTGPVGAALSNRRASRTGRITRVQTMVRNTPRVSNWPMLAVPGWEE